MKNYSDLQVTDLLLELDVEKIGNPDFIVRVNNNTIIDSKISLPLLDPITIEIELRNKEYILDYETAVIIKRLSIDNINIIPTYDYLAEYINDHNNTTPTHYLGFNGKWTLTIDCPFYCWLHHLQGQGWLLSA